MKKLVVASTEKSAGKTGLIVGIAAALGGKYGYIKPIGDRLLYRKKRLWDHDAALFVSLWKLDTKPEDITIGFEHAKLRYMYDREATKTKINEMVAAAGAGRDVVFIEAGNNLAFGSSVHLDPISLTKYIDGSLVLVVGGDEGSMMDEIHFFKNYIDDEGANLVGVIVNKVRDLEDFTRAYGEEIEATGIPILGIVPLEQQLKTLPVKFLVERLFARVVAGELGMDRAVESIFLGAMSVSAAMDHPMFERENKLFITSGDRSDMILAALEVHAACIVLTNNLLPPGNILSKASEAQVPVLLVPWDTFTTVEKISQIEPLLTIDAAAKIDVLKNLALKHVNLEAFAK
jgi:BioD-like phosphotransacetylase family protein